MVGVALIGNFSNREGIINRVKAAGFQLSRAINSNTRFLLVGTSRGQADFLRNRDKLDEAKKRNIKIVHDEEELYSLLKQARRSSSPKKMHSPTVAVVRVASPRKSPIRASTPKRKQVSPTAISLVVTTPSPAKPKRNSPIRTSPPKRNSSSPIVVSVATTASPKRKSPARVGSPLKSATPRKTYSPRQSSEASSSSSSSSSSSYSVPLASARSAYIGASNLYASRALQYITSAYGEDGFPGDYYDLLNRAKSTTGKTIDPQTNAVDTHVIVQIARQAIAKDRLRNDTANGVARHLDADTKINHAIHWLDFAAMALAKSANITKQLYDRTDLQRSKLRKAINVLQTAKGRL